MKNILSTLLITVSVLLSCNASSNNTDASAKQTQGNTEVKSASVAGSISCDIDGTHWQNDKAHATQTGNSFLNIASDDDQTEAISIILNQPTTTGTFSLNKGVSGSYTNAAGESYGSTNGSGSLVITKLTLAPDNKTDGIVEGTFSGTFAFDPTKKHTITNGKFSVVVKRL